MVWLQKHVSILLTSTFLVAVVLQPWPVSAAEIMFEGYYKVELEQKPIGFAIQRYEYDDKTKNFTSTYFLKVNLGGQVRQESLKAVSNDKFHPVSYSYTFHGGEEIKTIDAKYKVKGDKVSGDLTINDGKKTSNMNAISPKSTFLSNFLGYLMLQSGLDVGKKFGYSGIAEEDGNSYRGEAWIKETTTFNKQEAFKVINKFKGQSFISYVNKKAEVLGTVSPAQNLSTTLVASPIEATMGQTVPNKVLSQLFGNIPVGKANPLAKAKESSGEQK